MEGDEALSDLMIYRKEMRLTRDYSCLSFENHLKDILRGIDPVLDPSTLPATAQSHISNVNTRGPGGLQIRAPPGGNLDHARKDVAAIKRRMKMMPGDMRGIWEESGRRLIHQT